jgi:hypothetical protein
MDLISCVIIATMAFSMMMGMMDMLQRELVWETTAMTGNR